MVDLIKRVGGGGGERDWNKRGGWKVFPHFSTFA